MGCITYYLLTDTLPFPDFRALSGYCRGKSEFPRAALRKEGVSAEGVAFLHRLLITEPAARVTAENPLEHPWLSTITRPSSLEEARAEPPTSQTSEPVPMKTIGSTDSQTPTNDVSDLESTVVGLNLSGQTTAVQGPDK